MANGSGRRSGLHYTIKVDLQGFEELRRARAELNKIRQGWRKLKADMAAAVPQIKKVQQAQVQQAKTAQQLAAAQARASQERKKATKADAQAAIEQEKLKQQMAKTAAEQARATRVQNAATRSQRRATQQTRRHNQALKKTEQRANRISFTFRRLIGIFAAFQALRFVARGLGRAVDSGRQFNAFLEQSRLGIQALLTAATDVYGPDGVLVEGPAKFAALQREARRQTNLLEKDARRTAATYEQLVEAFQIAIGPGLRAGLTLDQLRRLSVAIAQAAAAIGLPMNQLNEEIRSLLSGTIQARTTRIAATLGITNEDIRRWREAGVLAERLFERFRAFELASTSAIQNFNVILTNLAATFRKTLGDATVQQFEELKDSLQGLQDSLEGAEGQQFGKLIAEFLQIALDTAKQLTAALDFRAVVELAQSLLSLLKAAAVVAVAIARGITVGLDVVNQVVRGILNALRSINTLVREAFGVDIGAGFTRVLVTVLALLAAIKSIVALSKVFAAIWATVGFGAIISALGTVAITIKGILVTSTVLFGVWRGLAATLGPLALLLAGIGYLIAQITGDSEKLEGAAGNLAQDFELSTVAILGSSKALEGAVDVVRKLQEEARKFREQLELAEAADSASSGAARIVQVFIEGRQRMSAALRDINEEITKANKEQEDSATRIADLRAREALFGKQSADAAELTRQGIEAIVKAESRREELVKSLAALEARKGALSKQQFAIEKEALELAIQRTREEVAREKQVLGALRGVNAAARLGVDTAKQLFELGLQRDAQEKRINELVTDRNRLTEENLKRTQDLLRLRLAETRDAREREQIEARIAESRSRIQVETEGQSNLVRTLRQQELRARNLAEESDRVSESILNRISLAERELELLREQGAALDVISGLEEFITRQRELLVTKTTTYANLIESIVRNIQRLRFDIAFEKVSNDILVLANRMGLFKSNVENADRILRPLSARLADVSEQARQLSFGPVSQEVFAIADTFAEVEGRATRVFERLDAQAETLAGKIAEATDQYELLAATFNNLARKAGLSEESIKELFVTIQQGDREALKAAEDVLEKNVQNVDIRKKLTKEILAAAKAFKEIRDLQSSLVLLGETRTRAEGTIKELLEEQLKLEIERLRVSRRRRTEDLQAELQALQLRQRAEDESPTARRRTELEAEEIVLRRQAELTDDRFKAEQNVLLRSRAAAKSKEQALEIDKALHASEKNRVAALALIEQRLRRINELQDRYDPESFGKGIQEGLRAMERAIDLFAIGFQTIQDLIQGFAQTAASFIVGLLDPDNYENMGERLLNFFKSLVEAILAELIKLAITRAILSFGSSAASSAGNFGPLEPIPANRGGRISEITTRRGSLPLSHIGAQGFSAGGDVRDKIPALLRKGEWVLTPETVNRYGRDFINAIHRGLIDPLDAARLTPAGRQMTRPSDGPGFASGGPVTEAAASGDRAIVLEAERVVDEGASLEVGREHGFKFGARRTLKNVNTGRTR